MSNLKVGIDVGNGYVKFKGQRFASRVKVGEQMKVKGGRKETHSIVYKGVNYTVGQGAIFTGENRYFTDNYKIALLTAVALASENKYKTVQAEICIGLPVQHFKRLKDKVQQQILSWGVQEIEVNGVPYTIEITDLHIFIEGALAALTADESRILTIDVGAGTVNVIEWLNGEIENSITLDKSYYNMCARIMDYLNTNHGAGLDIQEVEKIIGMKEISIRQQKIDISETEAIITEVISEMASNIKEFFNVNLMDKIVVFGGGAILTLDYWKKHFPKIQLHKNAQFVNSEVYDLVLSVEENE